MSLSPAAPVAPIQPPTLVVVGLNEAGWLRGSWHEPERDGRNGVVFRATQREQAEVRIGIPRPAPTDAGRIAPQRRVSLLFSGSPTLLGKPLRGEMTLVALGAEDRELQVLGSAPLELAADCWAVRSIDLPAPGASALGREVVALALRLTIEEPVIPDRMLHNGDVRALGWHVSAAGFGF